MGKLDQAAEKRLMNEAYADRFKKSVSDEEAEKAKELKRKGGKFANWCRAKGHPSTCSCSYATP